MGRVLALGIRVPVHGNGGITADFSVISTQGKTRNFLILEVLPPVNHIIIHIFISNQPLPYPTPGGCKQASYMVRRPVFSDVKGRYLTLAALAKPLAQRSRSLAAR